MLQVKLKGTRAVTLLAFLVALSLIAYVIESLFPPLFAFAPGAKLGLANLFIMLAVVFLGGRFSFIAVVAKCLLAMLLVGNPISVIYALVGGLLSLVATLIVYRTLYPKLSLIGVSVVGGLFHNLGQILVASVLLSSNAVFFYLPYLLLAGIAAGIVVGLAAHYSSVFLKKLYKEKPQENAEKA